MVSKAPTPAGRRPRDVAGWNGRRRDVRRACAVSRRHHVHPRSRPSPGASRHHQARSNRACRHAAGAGLARRAGVPVGLGGNQRDRRPRSAGGGVPVIASRIGGIPETVRHDVNGLLFEPGDASDLARQLRRLLDEPDLRRRLAVGVRDAAHPGRRRGRDAPPVRGARAATATRAAVVALTPGARASRRGGGPQLPHPSTRPRSPPRCCDGPKRRCRR